MNRFTIVAMLALPLAACAAGAAPPATRQVSTANGTLMSCAVTQSTGGEGGGIVYNMNCKPVVGGDIAQIENVDGDTFRVRYGSGTPAFGGGQVYILRYSGEPGEIRYGAPLDGNTGTVGR
jgi:hypothetical protein